MKKVQLECTMFYKDINSKAIKLLIVNDASNSYSVTEAPNKVIMELDPYVVSSNIFEALVIGLNNKGYQEVENTYEL